MFPRISRTASSRRDISSERPDRDRNGRLRDSGLLRLGPLSRVIAALDGAGEEVRLVGGAVRDLAIGATPGDFDLATTAPPRSSCSARRPPDFRWPRPGSPMAL